MDEFNLYFNDKYNKNRFIATCSEDKIIKNIKKFIKSVNSDFEVYYIRSWQEENKTWYDVGSHSEFFYTIKKQG